MIKNCDIANSRHQYTGPRCAHNTSHRHALFTPELITGYKTTFPVPPK